MSIVLVFDLDDTLYDERTYVESGFDAVAAFGQAMFGWDRGASLRFMLDVLDREGRGAVFDRWLASHGAYSRKLLQASLRCYRHHVPRISLNDQASALLPKLKGRPLYLVTDGHKIVQQRKIDALGIAPLFRRIFVTHRYGIANAKPSIYCFERIRQAEACAWGDIAYVADDPAKDFVNLNRQGAITIRVLTGRHRSSEAAPGYDAQHRISHLGELPELLRKLEYRS